MEQEHKMMLIRLLDDLRPVTSDVGRARMDLAEIDIGVTKRLDRVSEALDQAEKLLSDIVSDVVRHDRE